MQVFFGTDALTPTWDAAVACIGTFDGVHLGHQQVISQTVSLAKEGGVPSLVITFDRHPSSVLAPDRCPPAVGSLGTKLSELRELGTAVAIVLRFSESLSQTSATDFLENILVSKLRVGQLVIGQDFAFGKGRQANWEWLSSRIETRVVAPFEVEGTRCSSSHIRMLIRSGEVESASRLLGRPFGYEGLVSPGLRLGRTLGFPTLNLASTFNQSFPGHGVYAGWAQTPIGCFAAAISVGDRPTVVDAPPEPLVEAHLLDFPGTTLYGCAVKLDFISKVRDEFRFNSLDELRIQMVRDVIEVKRLLT